MFAGKSPWLPLKTYLFFHVFQKAGRTTVYFPKNLQLSTSLVGALGSFFRNTAVNPCGILSVLSWKWIFCLVVTVIPAGHCGTAFWCLKWGSFFFFLAWGSRLLCSRCAVISQGNEPRTNIFCPCGVIPAAHPSQQYLYGISPGAEGPGVDGTVSEGCPKCRTKCKAAPEAGEINPLASMHTCGFILGIHPSVPQGSSRNLAFPPCSANGGVII